MDSIEDIRKEGTYTGDAWELHKPDAVPWPDKHEIRRRVWVTRDICDEGDYAVDFDESKEAWTAINQSVGG